MGQLTKDEWEQLMGKEQDAWDGVPERGRTYLQGLKADMRKKMEDVSNERNKAQQAATTPRSERGAVLEVAMRTINGERQTQYGNPEDSFALIASYWSTYTGIVIIPSDVAMMMTLMKIAREQNGAGKQDNIVDACGYLALYDDMRGAI